ncbi:MAG: hypothetical protein JO353_11650, partial [Phycisphaerae bacterium]|nr:hypothetical protein [Phycisphaerae bacterium]
MAMSQDSIYSPHPRDAAAPVHEVFRIDAYQFSVPIGTIGRDESFWKRIDEQCVDVATYDLLFKNGLRIGVAPMSEFDGIKKHLDTDTSCKKITVNGAAGRKVQLETRKDLVAQTIFYFDGDNNAVGRSFDRSTNLIDLSFEATPRQPGSIRVSLAPEVRANRAQLEYSLLNEEREFQFVEPETFYDLNCRADIPRDSFLILTPSTDADRLTSMGHAFLTTDTSPQRTEQVIVLVPHVINEVARPTVSAALIP